MESSPTELAWAIAPRLNQTMPTYRWAGLRFYQAHVTQTAVNVIGARINARIAGFDWPQLQLNEGQSVEPVAQYRSAMREIVPTGDLRELCFTAGETLHYLRSCLDHLVYHASWFDHGSPRERTQFPIIERADDWSNKNVAKQLGGMSSTHASWIEDVQPFNGTQWLRNLQILSNSDKHRMGVEVSPACIFRADPGGVEVRTGDNIRSVPLSSIELQLRLPALGSTVNLGDVFTPMFVGIAALLNRFFLEEGVSPIELSLST